MSSEAAAVGELIELILTPRTVDDQPIAPEPGGGFRVGVDEPFDLEVSYEDFRTFGGDDGVFALFVDLTISQSDVLEPVLTETQRLIIGQELTQNSSGSLTFGLEGSATTYVALFMDLATDLGAEVVNALSALGFSTDQYVLTQLDVGGDFGFEIHFVGEEFEDADAPDVFMNSNFPISVPTSTIEFATRNPDGSINSAAVRFNINTASRTFNGGEHVYTVLNSGGFDPATGLIDVGGVGPASIGGIPALGTFIEPFDAFSLRVRFTEPVEGVVASLAPSSSSDILLYGSGEALLPSQVLLDADASVTLSAPEPNADLLRTAALAVASCVATRRRRRTRRTAR